MSFGARDFLALPIALMIALSLAPRAWGSSTKPSPTRNSRQRAAAQVPVLNHVTVIINGERTAVAAGADLGVFHGDHLFIIQAHVDAELVRPLAMPVDIEGFMARQPAEVGGADSHDDRGVDIRVADLPEGKLPVSVRYQGKVIGRFNLVVAKPRFDYAVVRINDRPVTVRQGDKIELAPQDTVQFESVRSNIQDVNRIEVRALDHGVMRFRYQGRTFGEIRLPVKSVRRNKTSGKQGH